jgi:formylglycine-generating enzyme required for sulfatase activity
MDEQPKHAIHMDAFEVDEFPVTVHEVYTVLKQNHLPLPAKWQFNPPPRNSELPAVNITCKEAERIAHLLGRSLPSEAHYELAAGGAFGRVWTHDRPGAGPLPLMDKRTSSKQGLTTPEGLIAMTGMIWHWTASTFCWYLDKNDDKRITFSNKWRSVRGGIWSSYDSRVSFRSFRDPFMAYERVGFRCMKK